MMGLLRVIQFVLLLIQFSGISTKRIPPFDIHAPKSLPRLPGNRLSEGEDRDLPNATPIHCGQSTVVTGVIKASKNPSEFLDPYFERYAFTAGPIGSPQSPRPGQEARFKVTEVKGRSYIYALQVDCCGERAYWLPQGGTIDIPRNPNANQPHYVFTPDFSGCSWTVTPLSDGNLRLRHVEGGKEHEQFNSKSENEKGGPVTYAMEYKDYGYIVETRRLISHVPGFAYMHFSGGRWVYHVQTKTCAPQAGGFTFRDHVLSGMTMVLSRSHYENISRNQKFLIP